LGDKASKLTTAAYADIKYNKPKTIKLSNISEENYEKVSLPLKDYYNSNSIKVTFNFYDAFIVKNTKVKFYLKEVKVVDHPETRKIDGLEFNVKPGYKKIFVVKLGACGAFLGPNKTNFREFMCQNLGGESLSSLRMAGLYWLGGKEQHGDLYIRGIKEPILSRKLNQ